MGKEDVDDKRDRKEEKCVRRRSRELGRGGEKGNEDEKEV